MNLLKKERKLTELSKDERIIQEKEKLDGIYSKLETDTKKSVSSLVDEAAFMAASLYELRQIINTKGYTEEYQNGENQKGTKKCSEVEIYIQLNKNYMAIMKQLTDLLPKAPPPPNNDGYEDFLNEKEE